MNRRLVVCLGLSIPLAMSVAALHLFSGGGWLGALMLYSVCGSACLTGLALVPDRPAVAARSPRPREAASA